jgi:hypothetical protein
MKRQPAPTRFTVHRAARCAALLGLLSLSVPAQAATPAELLAAYVRQAGADASPERGQAIFTRKSKGTLFESCADCHTTKPTGKGKDQATDKAIAPMAPAANPQRFNDAGRVENFFRLNCKDVIGRECTALEKADVMSWLISLKP